jgi:hypothetical protein
MNIVNARSETDDQTIVDRHSDMMARIPKKLLANSGWMGLSNTSDATFPRMASSPLCNTLISTVIPSLSMCKKSRGIWFCLLPKQMICTMFDGPR